MSVNFTKYYQLQQIVVKIENGEEVTREELELRDENGSTALHHACSDSTNAVLEQVLDKMKQVGFKPNEIKGQKNLQNRSGIHEAAQSPVESKAKVETLVLKHSFDVNEAAGELENDNSNDGFDQDTPIVAAHNQYNLDTMAFLFENGVKEVLTEYDRMYFEDIINGSLEQEEALAQRAARKAAVKQAVNRGLSQTNNYTRKGITDEIRGYLGPGYGGRKKTKKRKLNKRKKTQKKLKKKTRKQKKIKRKTTKRK